MRFGVTAKEIVPGIYEIVIPVPTTMGFVNVYLLEGTSLTLVDAGPAMEEAWRALMEGIEQTGHHIRDVEQVILTHHHMDHSGLLERVRHVSGARTFAHPYTEPYVRMEPSFLELHARFFNELFDECGITGDARSRVWEFHKFSFSYMRSSRIDEFLNHGQRLPNLPDWEVVHTPGHCSSHLSFYRPKDRLLIGGDNILKESPTVAAIDVPPDPSVGRVSSLLQYRDSLKLCASMDIDLMLTSHGSPVTDHRELIQSKLAKHEERAGKVAGMLKGGGGKTVYELMALLFPHKMRTSMMLILAETLGYLDLLQQLGVVYVEKQDGVMYYFV